MNEKMTIAFEKSNLDDLKEIARRFDACRAMLETIRGEVDTNMPKEYETGKAMYGVVSIMEDALEWLTCIVKNTESKEAAV